MRYVGRIRLKDELTPGDNERIADISEFISKPPGGPVRRWAHIYGGLNDIIKILTRVRFPWLIIWNRSQKINAFMEAHDLLKKGGPVDDQVPVKQRLKELAAYFCVELKITELRFKTEMTMAIIPELYIKLMRDKIEHWTMAACAQHSPKQIKDFARKLRTQIAMTRAKEGGKIRTLPVSPRPVTAGGIVGMIP